MSNAVVSRTTNALGKKFQTNRTTEGEGGVIADPTLAAAKTGSLTTRTDGAAGTLTMAGGHGITTGAKLHLYWTNADGSIGHRYTTVGTVATNSVPVSTGGGDALPPLNTAVTAQVPQQEAFSVATANLQGLFVGGTGPTQAVFLDDSNAVVKAVFAESAEDAFQWDAGDAAANPLADDVAAVLLSQGDSARARQVNVVALVN